MPTEKERSSVHCFLKLSTNVACHCLSIINDWENALFRSKENHTVKNQQPEFALGQTDAAANIFAPLGCFVTASSRYFGPRPFCNVNIVLDVHMQTLIAFFIISTTSNSSKFLSKVCLEKTVSSYIKEM